MNFKLCILIFFFSAPMLLSSQNSEPVEAVLIEPEPQGSEHFVPDNYVLTFSDDFSFFNSDNWSKGLTHDTDPDVKMIWNKTSGGKYLLNDNYAGYLLDKNVYAKNGALHLDNVKEEIQGVDPARTFDYSTGWINSLQKVNFNGTERAVYLEVKAKFPKGPKVWPAIWLVDDSENRGWPPEIDIWEYFGRFFNTKHTDQMYMRYIYGKWNDKHDHSVPINEFHDTYNAAETWHVYGYQWTNNEMKWFIDGKLIHSKSRGVEVPSADWPNVPMCLVINNGLLTVVDEGATSFPNSLVLDYLKIYHKTK